MVTVPDLRLRRGVRVYSDVGRKHTDLPENNAAKLRKLGVWSRTWLLSAPCRISQPSPTEPGVFIWCRTKCACRMGSHDDRGQRGGRTSDDGQFSTVGARGRGRGNEHSSETATAICSYGGTGLHDCGVSNTGPRGRLMPGGHADLREVEVGRLV